MRRRAFISLLGGAAVLPLVARAQQAGKLPTIGFLGGPTASTAGQWVTVFRERLRELGWIEGRTVALEVRWAEGRTERFAEIASEFVGLKVDVIVTAGTSGIRSETGYFRHPDRVRDGGGPSWHWPRRQSVEAGRSEERRVGKECRSRGEAEPEQ